MHFYCIKHFYQDEANIYNEVFGPFKDKAAAEHFQIEFPTISMDDPANFEIFILERSTLLQKVSNPVLWGFK